MSHYKNKSPNLRQKDVIDAIDSTATKLPASANSVRVVAESVASMRTSGVPVLPKAATVSLKISEDLEEENSITIGDEVYVFVESLSEPGEAEEGVIEVEIGDSINDSRDNLKNAFDSSKIFDAATWSGSTIKLTAKTKGESAHAIELSTVLEEGDGFDKESFTGGVNGTVASKGEIMVGTTKLYVAVDDCTKEVSNWKHVALSNGI